jgi:hypothetical protein
LRGIDTGAGAGEYETKCETAREAGGEQMLGTGGVGGVGGVGGLGGVGEESASRSGELGKLRVGRVSGERRDDREEGLEGKYACFKAGMDFMLGECVAPEGRKFSNRHKQGGGDDE